MCLVISSWNCNKIIRRLKTNMENVLDLTTRKRSFSSEEDVRETKRSNNTAISQEYLKLDFQQKNIEKNQETIEENAKNIQECGILDLEKNNTKIPLKKKLLNVKIENIGIDYDNDKIELNQEVSNIYLKVNLLDGNVNNEEMEKTFNINLNHMDNEKKMKFADKKDDVYLIEVNPISKKKENVHKFEHQVIRVDITTNEVVNEKDCIPPNNIDTLKENSNPSHEKSSQIQSNTQPIEINILLTNADFFSDKNTQYILKSNISDGIQEVSYNKIKPSSESDDIFDEWDQYYALNLELPPKKELSKFEIMVLRMEMKILLKIVTVS